MPSEWQPINTAPKDGTEFLAWDSRVREMGVCVWIGEWQRIVPVQGDSFSTDAPTEDEQHDLRLSFAHWIAGCCGLALLAALIGMALP